jgi:hypothetical protein
MKSYSLDLRKKIIEAYEKRDRRFAWSELRSIALKESWQEVLE